LAFGHCRIPEGKKDIDDIVARSVEQLGEDKQKMEFIYSQTARIEALFRELSIPYEKRAFGIIPKSSCRGGKTIMSNLIERLPNIATDYEMINFQKDKEGYSVAFMTKEGLFQAHAPDLVLATGGYGGAFSTTNNASYKHYNVFALAKKAGATIANLDCIFLHPFGYDDGKSILLGPEVAKGEFIDDKGEFVFDRKTRALLKSNEYHEQFHLLVRAIDHCRLKGSTAYFIDPDRTLEIQPTVHYTSGGIVTDHAGRVVGCNNLYAIGECQANGSKNQGRFPGYPFTAAIVQAKELAENVFRRRLR
jgi:aspartate oxidase